jgi:hypothetical protein
MVQKWLATVSVLAVLAAGPAKADVIYTFFDSASPSTVDLDFSVADQLSPANPTEPLLSTSGVFASDFVGGTGVYSQGSPGFQPAILARGMGAFRASEFFTGFPFGNPANGVPGNGTFPVLGEINDSSTASQSVATISGVPAAVPEPSSMILLLAGLLSLGWALRVRAAPRQ